ncbi:MAG: DNA polymerase III subunit delta [Desulfuromonadaceae bacterium GWC2_58_13]|nr:MAG: DNA polymerase III subunit delta [Desulfuromonadaceae bacterium GWC2_58_13]
MTPAELSRAIDNKEFPNLLFLYGEETYLLEKCLRQLLDAAVPVVDRDFNFDNLSARDIRVEAIIDQARTFPVFAVHRLVLIKDAQHLSSDSLDDLVPYLQDPSPETVLVFVSDKIDGRRKFFQEFKKRGALVEFKKLYDNQIPMFVRDQARQGGRSFTEDALALLCRRVGNNLQEIYGELSKLFAYIGDKTLIDVADVAAIISDTRVDSVFELTDALGMKKAEDAQRFLVRILDEGSAPLLVLSMIVRHFRQLWKIHELLELKTQEKEIPRQVGINPYFLKGLLNQAGRFSHEQYRNLFERFLEADLALKSSGAHPTAILGSLISEIALPVSSLERRQ